MKTNFWHYQDMWWSRADLAYPGSCTEGPGEYLAAIEEKKGGLVWVNILKRNSVCHISQETGKQVRRLSAQAESRKERSPGRSHYCGIVIVSQHFIASRRHYPLLPIPLLPLALTCRYIPAGKKTIHRQNSPAYLMQALFKPGWRKKPTSFFHLWHNILPHS